MIYLGAELGGLLTLPARGDALAAREDRGEEGTLEVFRVAPARVVPGFEVGAEHVDDAFQLFVQECL